FLSIAIKKGFCLGIGFKGRAVQFWVWGKKMVLDTYSVTAADHLQNRLLLASLSFDDEEKLTAMSAIDQVMVRVRQVEAELGDRFSTSGRYLNFSKQVGNFLDHPTLCGRCYDVIAGQPPRVLSVVS
ncbi:hypothetical protein Tco_0902790, partial [Tanacetum coccineum]